MGASLLRHANGIKVSGMILTVILIMISIISLSTLFFMTNLIGWQRILSNTQAYYSDYYRLEHALDKSQTDPSKPRLLACYNCTTLGACFYELQFRKNQQTLSVILKQPFLYCQDKPVSQRIVSWKHT